jgi:hypothetical protein
MSPERFRQIRDIFEQVLDRHPEERMAVLRDLCRDDSELLDEVLWQI